MKVRIVDWGYVYTTYDKWLKHYNLFEYLERYHQKYSLFNSMQFGYFNLETKNRVLNHTFGSKKEAYLPYDEKGKIIDTTNITYNVIASYNHTDNNGKYLYLIEEPITNKVYLIERDGIEMIEEDDE